ncbi:hypothetical protein IWQ47_004138 [Aquimarina sp. EL_43]|uniref:hypothetical protein n=1 Tax=Aquimarina TaxID=290174 RepID=UPI0004711A1E|nr:MULTISPECIES: hypothetical protein [Aquimarina]MBG6132902.1 hypothetical protein [Aquimarina sp. EL_35]MBG6152213.1 hypothetical protein [Aquimarina sp. EL_32]MBG6171051.1 hypothetical protein [Aquimarina sp. EL_43]
MKLFSTAFLVFFIINLNYSQTKKNVFFEQKALTKKFHTIDELEDLKKGELVKLYTDRINEIITVLPYLALTNEAGVKLSDIGIKESSDHLKSLNKHHTMTTDMTESNKNLISEFIPYADTEKIIWGILYFEEVIKKVRIGANGNF